MESINLPFNPYPIIEGNHVDVADLYFIVVTNGGSERIAAERGWVNVAISVWLPTEQFPNAPQELANYWNQNLLEYEESRKFGPNQSSNDQSAKINIKNVQNEEISAPSPSFDL